MEKNLKGLSSEEAQKKLSEFGPNQIFKPAKIGFFGIAGNEITEPMILLLFVVGFFYSVWGKIEDAVTIFAVIILLVLAEVYNEFRAKKAISSLEKIAAPYVKVIRDAEIKEIRAENIVPGDILVLTSGTKIAADAKIKTAIGLETDESALTGESFPQNKKIGDEIYAGTVIASGEGAAEVFNTGADTRLGKIAAALKEIKPPQTALQLAMKSLSAKLVYLALFFSVSIPILGIFRGQDLKTMILTGLSLSFATIPEELPIIITMVLGLGAYNLSKNNFLVKKLKSAEILGNATVIVTDKTGTITEGKLKISGIFPKEAKKEILKNALETISPYSLSPLDKEIQSEASKEKIGPATDEIIRQRTIGDGKKTKAVVRKNENVYALFLSGAPEEIFMVCFSVDEKVKNELEKETKNGKRVIAVASRHLGSEELNSDFGEIEKEMNFSGLISFEDPPRPGVAETISIAKKAGIRTIMVTGDHPATAGYIAKKVGISQGEILTGKDLAQIKDEQLKETVKSVSVFARTTPQDKYRIVRALQENGEVTAVTGDGINDTLALKASDIGIAMGKKGTDVAKEAAEIVLADDNYITITQGIFEGRKFFDNLQKGLKYYLSVKIALVLIFLLPVVLGIPLPLSPIQIIILELFMDLAASAGFISEPKEKNIYSRPPRNPKENLLSNKVIFNIFVKGIFFFLAVMGVYLLAHLQKLSFKETQTFVFAAWIFGHIALAFVSRSDKEPLSSSGIFGNPIINLWALGALGFLFAAIYFPFIGQQFNLVRVSPVQIGSVALIAVLIISLLEIKKYLGFNRNKITIK